MIFALQTQSMQPVLFLLSFLVVSTGFLIDIKELASYLHDQCLDWVSLKGQWTPVYKALVCGKKLPHGQLKEVFIKGGLIHLMVVSGAHLLFLERLWNKLPLPFFKQTGLFLFLVFYALITHLHPPVVRSLFSFFLFQINRRFKLFWSQALITHLSGILCLFYSPQWIHSVSLHLSWLAGLAQTFSTSSIKRSLFTYIIVFPIISQWQFLHPLTVLINWLAAPVIGFVLLPLSFMTVAFPFLQGFSDRVWEGMFFILKFFNRMLPDFGWQPDLSVFKEYIWFYIGCVFLTVCLSGIWSKRLGWRF